jgi:hypothetical protein
MTKDSRLYANPTGSVDNRADVSLFYGPVK